MDHYAYDKGYLISLISNRNNDDFVEQVISRQCDGIIVSSLSIPEEYIHRFIDVGLAVVVLQNRDYKNLSGAAVIQTGLYAVHGRGSIIWQGRGGRISSMWIDSPLGGISVTAAIIACTAISTRQQRWEWLPM